MRPVSSEVTLRKEFFHSGIIRLAAILGLIGCTYIFLLATSLGPINGFWSSDQGTKLIQTQSLLLTKYRTNALIYPGEVFDPDHKFSPLHGTYFERDGAFFSIWSPLFAFVSSIPFFFLGFPGLYVVPIISSLVLLWACAQISRNLFGSIWPVLTVLICGLASPIFFYSLIFWEHTLVAMLIILALWSTVRGLQEQRMSFLFVAGFLIGLAAWFRIETILFTVALGLGLVALRQPRTWRLIWWCGLGATITFCGLLIFNQFVYGNFIGPHVLVSGAANYGNRFDLTTLIQAWINWASLLFTPLDYPLVLASLLLLIVALAASKFAGGHYITWACLALSLVLMIGIAAFAQAQMRVGLQSTMLIAFPIVLLCFLPIPRSDYPEPRATAHISDRQIIRLFTWVGVIFTGLAWMADLPWGGAQWGPRLLLPIMPLLTMIGLWRASRWFIYTRSLLANIALIVTLIALISISAYSEYRGSLQIKAFNVVNHTITTTVAQSNQKVIITDIWYAPPVIAPLFYDRHLVYLLTTGAELDTLLERLSDQGINSFYYLSAHSSEISANSKIWPRLAPIGPAQRLGHNLTGTGYNLSH